MRNNWVKYGPWLAAPRLATHFEDEKLLIRKIVGETLIATYYPKQSYCNTLLFILKAKCETSWNLKSLLGILNSKLIGWYFRKKFQIGKEDTFPQIMIRDILQFPLPSASITLDSQMQVLVQEMLQRHERLAAVKTDHDKTLLQRQISSTDTEIDRLVYDLYGLTNEEIRIVEGER